MKKKPTAFIDSESEDDTEEVAPPKNEKKNNVVTNIESSDESDDDEEGKKSSEYIENSWPCLPEQPKGYTYKGKTRLFAYAVDKTKSTLRKGAEKEFKNTKFKILDV